LPAKAGKSCKKGFMLYSSFMEKREVNPALECVYENEIGPNAGFSLLSKSQKNEIEELLIAATFNYFPGKDPVTVVSEHGIPRLSAATGLVSLINEGVLERGTLKLQIQENGSKS
jgi:hypothetical protein